MKLRPVVFFLCICVFSFMAKSAKNVYAGNFTPAEADALLEHERTNFITGASTIKTVNVVSGAPLVSDQDKSGGFGDVASNLYAVRELKKRNPKLNINFLITTDARSKESMENGIMESDQIIKTLVPSLDITKANLPQNIDGIDFYVLGGDARNFLVDNYRNAHPELKDIIPHSDLSIQLSANDSPKVAILNTNSKIAFSFFEYSGAESALSSINTENYKVTYGAGPNSNGIYFRMGLETPSKERQGAINTWLLSHQRRPINFENDSLGFTYTKEPATSLAYLSAVAVLAAKQPDKQFRVFVKSFPNNPFAGQKFPPNLDVIVFPPISDTLMESLITESKLSPLVTGDMSVSTALSSVRPKKGFFYEILPWKKAFADALAKKITQMTGNAAAVNRMFVDPNAINIAAMAHHLADETFNSKLHEQLTKNRQSLDLLAKLPMIYHFSRLFKYELADFGANDLHGFGEEIRQLSEIFFSAKNYKDVPKLARTTLMTADTPMKQVNAGVILLKSKTGLDYDAMETMAVAISKLKSWQLSRLEEYLIIGLGRLPVQKLLIYLMTHKDNAIRDAGLELFGNLNSRKNYNELRSHSTLDRIRSFYEMAEKNGFSSGHCPFFYIK